MKSHLIIWLIQVIIKLLEITIKVNIKDIIHMEPDAINLYFLDCIIQEE